MKSILLNSIFASAILAVSPLLLAANLTLNVTDTLDGGSPASFTGNDSPQIHYIVPKGTSLTVNATAGSDTFPGSNFTWNFGSGASVSTANGMGPHIVTFYGPSNVTFSTNRTDPNNGNIACTSSDVPSFFVDIAKIQQVGAGGNVDLIADNGTQTNPSYFIGQPISFIASISGPFATNATYAWTIPGTYFKSFTYNSSGATYQGSSAVALGNQTVQYYLLNGGSGAVSCALGMVGGIYMGINGTITVYSPSYSVGVTIGSVGNETDPNNLAGFGLGNFSAHQDGIDLQASGSIGGSGNVTAITSWIQVINSASVNGSLTANGTMASVASITNKFDTIASSGAGLLLLTDSPSSPYGSYVSMNATFSYTTWLMFTPVINGSSSGSMPVPVQVISWGWSGAASKSGSTWSVSGSPSPSSPSASAATSFPPTWTGSYP